MLFEFRVIHNSSPTKQILRKGRSITTKIYFYTSLHGLQIVPEKPLDSDGK